MMKIAVLATASVLAVAGGSTAAFAFANATPQASEAPHATRAVLGGTGPAFVRSGHKVVPLTAGDDRNRRHKRAEDHRRHQDHAEPGDDHGSHAEPGDDKGGHGGHGGHGSDD